MAIINQILNEKLRPKTLKDMVLLDRIAKQISEDIPQHLLLMSSAGTGKTSLCKVLASKYPTKIINASSEARIELLREELTEFCATRSINQEKNSIKVVILDEIDGASSAFFAALRPLMEKFQNVRFLATANYENKIPEPILSRFSPIKFEPINSKEEKELLVKYSKRIIEISKANGLKWESKEVLKEFIEKFAPDLRTIISKIQSFIVSKIEIISSENIKQSQYSFIDLYKLLISEPNTVNNYKIIMGEYVNKVSDVFYSLSREFPEWFIENSKKTDKLPQILISIADWEFKSRNAIDPILHLLACFYQCQQIYNN